MKKIISVFQRNYDGDRLVRDEVVPGAEWVLAGEGVATQKFDGTACMVRDGRLYKRYDCKRGRKTPPDFEPCEDKPNEKTGHWPGWVPVTDKPEDQYHREAYENRLSSSLSEGSYEALDMSNGTYELIGPKVQGNPEKRDVHVLVRHGDEECLNCPRTFQGIKDYLAQSDIEGIVWHHPDGRMAKIKKRDFGLSRDPGRTQ